MTRRTFVTIGERCIEEIEAEILRKKIFRKMGISLSEIVGQIKEKETIISDDA